MPSIRFTNYPQYQPKAIEKVLKNLSKITSPVEKEIDCLFKCKVSDCSGVAYNSVDKICMEVFFGRIIIEVASLWTTWIKG